MAKDEPHTRFFGAFPLAHKRPLSPQERCQTQSIPKHPPLIAPVVDVYALPKSIASQPILLCFTSSTKSRGCASRWPNCGPQRSSTSLSTSVRIERRISSHHTHMSISSVYRRGVAFRRPTNKQSFIKAEYWTIFIALVRTWLR